MIMLIIWRLGQAIARMGKLFPFFFFFGLLFHTTTPQPYKILNKMVNFNNELGVGFENTKMYFPIILLPLP